MTSASASFFCDFSSCDGLLERFDLGVSEVEIWSGSRVLSSVRADCRDSFDIYSTGPP